MLPSPDRPYNPTGFSKQPISPGEALNKFNFLLAQAANGGLKLPYHILNPFTSNAMNNGCINQEMKSFNSNLGSSYSPKNMPAISPTLPLFLPFQKPSNWLESNQSKVFPEKEYFKQFESYQLSTGGCIKAFEQLPYYRPSANNTMLLNDCLSCPKVSTFQRPFLPLFPSSEITKAFPWCYSSAKSLSDGLSAPELPQEMSATWWKLGNMMLANHLLNSHFIQAVNNSSQKVSECVVSKEDSSKESKFHSVFPANQLESSSARLSSSDAKGTVTDNSYNMDKYQLPQKQEECDTTTSPSHLKKERQECLKVSSSKIQYSDKIVSTVSNGIKMNHKLHVSLSSNHSSTKLSFVNNQVKSVTNCSEKAEDVPMHHFFTNGLNQQSFTLPWASQPTRLPVFNPNFQCNSLHSSSTPAIQRLESNVGAPSKEKRTHRCCYCGKLYSRKYGLKIHIRTHTGYKPLKCKVIMSK